MRLHIQINNKCASSKYKFEYKWLQIHLRIQKKLVTLMKIIHEKGRPPFVKSAIIQPKQVMTTQPVVANRKSLRLKKTRNNA